MHRFLSISYFYHKNIEFHKNAISFTIRWVQSHNPTNSSKFLVSFNKKNTSVYLVEQFVHGNNSLVYSSPSRLCWTFLINQLCLISTVGSAVDACWQDRSDCVLLVADVVVVVSDESNESPDIFSLMSNKNHSWDTKQTDCWTFVCS